MFVLICYMQYHDMLWAINYDLIALTLQLLAYSKRARSTNCNYWLSFAKFLKMTVEVASDVTLVDSGPAGSGIVRRNRPGTCAKES